jgi:hypothetical protein
VFFEPLFGFRVLRQLSLDDSPESRGVIRLKQVGKLVNDDVLDHIHRGFYQPPVEIEVVLWGARTPPVFQIGDQHPVVFDAELAGEGLYFGRDDPLRSLHKPVSDQLRGERLETS